METQRYADVLPVTLERIPCLSEEYDSCKEVVPNISKWVIEAHEERHNILISLDFFNTIAKTKTTCALWHVFSQLFPQCFQLGEINANRILILSMTRRSWWSGRRKTHCSSEIDYEDPDISRTTEKMILADISLETEIHEITMLFPLIQANNNSGAKSSGRCIEPFTNPDLLFAGSSSIDSKQFNCPHSKVERRGPCLDCQNETKNTDSWDHQWRIYHWTYQDQCNRRMPLSWTESRKIESSSEIDHPRPNEIRDNCRSMQFKMITYENTIEREMRKW